MLSIFVWAPQSEVFVNIWPIRISKDVFNVQRSYQDTEVHLKKKTWFDEVPSIYSWYFLNSGVRITHNCKEKKNL